MMKSLSFGIYSALCAILLSGAAQAQDYFLYVAAESEDEVHLIHFDAETEKAVIEETITVGRMPTEIDGPHGMTVSPDGEHWFVSIAHGNPYGWLAKYRTSDNTLVGTAELGFFPASMEISEATGLLYVVNFDLHGEMVPSTVTVVDPVSMEVVTDIPTGIMPHGNRMNSTGDRAYHVSMMSDELIELNTTSLSVERRIPLGAAKSDDHAHHQGMMDMQMQGMDSGHHDPVEKPTWADPHPTNGMVYVAANGSDELLEIDPDDATVTRRFSCGKAPYNLEVSANGELLVASYKGEGATGIWDIKTGTELAKIRNSRGVSHGVAISPDSKYAFISVEGVGGEPGSVDVIDLQKKELVAVAETGKQAGGIYFWKQIQ
jgi:DNA-binding beta-propeller fold protein YncE